LVVSWWAELVPKTGKKYLQFRGEGETVMSCCRGYTALFCPPVPVGVSMATGIRPSRLLSVVLSMSGLAAHGQTDVLL
jgi:hypothetical protein